MHLKFWKTANGGKKQKAIAPASPPPPFEAGARRGIFRKRVGEESRGVPARLFDTVVSG